MDKMLLAKLLSGAETRSVEFKLCLGITRDYYNALNSVNNGTRIAVKGKSEIDAAIDSSKRELAKDIMAMINTPYDRNLDPLKRGYIIVGAGDKISDSGRDYQDPSIEGLSATMLNKLVRAHSSLSTDLLIKYETIVMDDGKRYGVIITEPNDDLIEHSGKSDNQLTGTVLYRAYDNDNKPQIRPATMADRAELKRQKHILLQNLPASSHIHPPTRSRYSSIDPISFASQFKFSNIKNFHQFPTIDVLYSNRIRIGMVDPPFKLYAPTFEEIIADDHFSKLDTQHLRERYTQAQFSRTDTFRKMPTGLPSLSAVNVLLSNEGQMQQARVTALNDYLLSRSGFNHNGIMLAPVEIRKGADEKEERTYSISLCISDYYSYRVIVEHGQATLLDALNGKLEHGLSEYIASHLQRGLHLSLSIAAILHTRTDNKVIITRRSAHAANQAGEAGKLFMSANEGLNADDIGTDRRTVDIYRAIKRSINEEIYGILRGKDELSSIIHESKFTGLFLYLPNMSIGMCFYVSLNCDSEEVKRKYEYARDRGIETISILPSIGEGITLPDYTEDGIMRFIDQTTARENPSLTWCEGSLIALIYAMLPLREAI